MLGCRFNSKAYAKKVREKATKCSLKTDEVLVDVDGHMHTRASLIFIKVQ